MYQQKNIKFVFPGVPNQKLDINDKKENKHFVGVEQSRVIDSSHVVNKLAITAEVILIIVIMRNFLTLKNTATLEPTSIKVVTSEIPKSNFLTKYIIAAIVLFAFYYVLFHSFSKFVGFITSPLKVFQSNVIFVSNTLKDYASSYMTKPVQFLNKVNDIVSLKIAVEASKTFKLNMLTLLEEDYRQLAFLAEQVAYYDKGILCGLPLTRNNNNSFILKNDKVIVFIEQLAEITKLIDTCNLTKTSPVTFSFLQGVYGDSSINSKGTSTTDLEKFIKNNTDLKTKLLNVSCVFNVPATTQIIAVQRLNLILQQPIVVYAFALIFAEKTSSIMRPALKVVGTSMLDKIKIHPKHSGIFGKILDKYKPMRHTYSNYYVINLLKTLFSNKWKSNLNILPKSANLIQSTVKTIPTDIIQLLVFLGYTRLFSVLQNYASAYLTKWVYEKCKQRFLNSTETGKRIADLYTLFRERDANKLPPD